MELGTDLAESKLISEFRIKDIGNVSPEIRSSYVVSCNSKSHAAISHTNRTISIVDTKRMVKIFELQSNDRTIWTIAYHPRIPSLLATGSVGGIVTVYENYVQKATIQEFYGNQAEFGNIIPSICFHPLHDFVAYSSRRDVKIWDWRNNRLLYNLEGNSTTRFMKFNPVNNMLITIQTYQQYNDSNCVSNFFNMIAAVSLLLNCAYEPCYVKDAINNVINKLVKISLKCQLDCDSQNFLNSKNFDRILDDLDTTITMWYRKLSRFSSDICQVKDNIKCSFFIDKLIKHTMYCEKMDNNCKTRLISCLEKGKAPIKVALQLCLSNSWKIQHEYLRQKGADEDLLLFPDDHTYPNAPKILQVWDFEDKPDLCEGWYGAITQCESHNDVSVDVSQCGKKVAVFYRKLDSEQNSYSRLRVFSIERDTLGELLHNIQPNAYLNEEFIGVTFSPSSNYLIMVRRQNTEENRSTISVHRLDKDVVNIDTLKTYEIDRNVGFVKWAPNPGDGILLGFSTYVLSYWSYN